MDKTFAFILIAAFIFVAIVVTKTSSMTEYRNKFCRVVGRSMIERTYGRSRRENAGISSESMVRIHAIESLRFPGEGSSAQGKSGPKVRPKSVADG